MKIFNNRSILLGLGLLGATTLIGFNSPASAQPGHDPRGKQRIETKRTITHRTVTKTVVRKPVVVRPVDRRPVVVRPVVRRPIVVRPVVRPGHHRPIYTRPVTSIAAYDGIVTNDTRGDDFNIRTSSGQIWHVYANNGEPGALSKGDKVRVTGRKEGGTFRASSVTILRNR